MTADPVWEDGNWTPLAPLRGATSADACVVGLGGSGLSCIHELLEMGLSVVGVDAAGVGSGAAGRNGGFLLAGCYHFYHDAVARYGRDRALAIYRATLDQVDRIERETPDAVRRTGSLRLASEPDELDDCAAQLQHMRADGLPVEEYQGAEGAGLLFPRDAAFNPLLRVRRLAQMAVQRGARLFEQSPVTGLRQGLVMLSDATVTCDHIFVAVDGGLIRLLPELSGTVRTARLQMLATAPAPEVRIPRPVYARFGFEYWQQLPDGRVALGGFRDQFEEEWTDDPEPSVALQSALERHLREEIGVLAPITHRWAASVGYTADGLPVFDEPRLGVHAFGAYSGTGNVIGALCGRAAARLAVTGDTRLASPFLAPTEPAAASGRAAPAS